MNKIINGLKWFFRSFIWLFVLFLTIDIVTKLIIMYNMELGRENAIVLIPGFLQIAKSYNAKAAFGMGFASNEVNRWMYVVIALLGSGLVIFFYVKNFKKFNMYIKACLMLILTGAVGNLIDRLFYAPSNYCVVDWIDFVGIWDAIFNIADSCIVVACFMLIIYLIVMEVKDYKAKKASEPEDNTRVLSKVEQEKKEHDNKE